MSLPATLPPVDCYVRLPRLARSSRTAGPLAGGQLLGQPTPTAQLSSGQKPGLFLLSADRCVGIG